VKLFSPSEILTDVARVRPGDPVPRRDNFQRVSGLTNVVDLLWRELCRIAPLLDQGSPPAMEGLALQGDVRPGRTDSTRTLLDLVGSHHPRWLRHHWGQGRASLFVRIVAVRDTLSIAVRAACYLGYVSLSSASTLAPTKHDPLRLGCGDSLVQLRPVLQVAVVSAFPTKRYAHNYRVRSARHCRHSGFLVAAAQTEAERYAGGFAGRTQIPHGAFELFRGNRRWSGHDVPSFIGSLCRGRELSTRALVPDILAPPTPQFNVKGEVA